MEDTLSMRSVPGLYNENQLSHETADFDLTEAIECGGGVEYLHRSSPASSRRRRKRSLESETVKYGHESHWTRTREWFRWRGPYGCFIPRQTGRLTVGRNIRPETAVIKEES
jgi:hypothetical protein